MCFELLCPHQCAIQDLTNISPISSFFPIICMLSSLESHILLEKKLLKKIIKKNSVISSKRHNIKVGFVKNYRILMDLGACITVCK